MSAGEAVKSFALDESYQLLFDAYKGNRQVNNMYCIRELLHDLATNSSQPSPHERKFFEGLRDIFKGEEFHPRVLFNSVYELGEGRGERALVKDALLRNLDVFDAESAVRIKEEFELSDIVFVTPEYRGIAIAGGIATMVSDLCECLAEMGLNVSIIIPYYKFNT